MDPVFPTDYEIIDAMIQYGGGFVAKLGHLFHYADPANQARLRAAFPEYWAEYRDLANLRAKQSLEDRV